MYVLVITNIYTIVTPDLRYVVMIAMVLHALNSLLSAYGAFSESRAVLIGSLVLRCLGYKLWNTGYNDLTVCQVYCVLGDPGRCDRDLSVWCGGEQTADQGARRCKKHFQM